ncbi:MAG: hypothetical protein ACTSWV_03660 [Candidatus Asgardarchaeia archaeon]
MVETRVRGWVAVGEVPGERKARWPAQTEDEADVRKASGELRKLCNSSTIQKFWLWWKPPRGRRSHSFYTNVNTIVDHALESFKQIKNVLSRSVGYFYHLTARIP